MAGLTEQPVIEIITRSRRNGDELFRIILTERCRIFKDSLDQRDCEGPKPDESKYCIMAKEVLPKLTEAHIRKLANEQSFERGKSYFHGGAILEPVRQGGTLRAYCEGSTYEPYYLIVTLGKEGVADMSCTCPYDWGGICKHLVALLLTYAHKPQAFRVIAPLKTMLAGRSKEELIALIDEMVGREPSLISMVELMAATKQNRRGKPVDVEPYRRQARKAMRQDNSRAIEKELKSLIDIAVRLGKADDLINAGAVFQAALEEAACNYDGVISEMDEDGDIASLIDDIAEWLSYCLEKSDADSQTRLSWLGALLGAKLADIEMGGIDLAPGAAEDIIEQATDEEWDWIEERVRAEISKSRDWARESLVEFLVEGQRQRGRESDAAALIRETGTPEQQALLLASEGEIQEAVRCMRKILVDKPGLLTQFADALLEAGANDAAVLLVRSQEKNWQSAEWLAKYYRKHGNPQQALEAQQNLFFNSPSVEKFKDLRAASQKLGAWEKVRAGALKRLERENEFGALIEIALHEREVGRALELLPRVEGGWRDYKSEVTEAAEKDHPAEALALYKEMAERAIDGRSRPSYRLAAQHLKRAKALYELLNAKSDWIAYIQALRAQYANLPALQDEMRKARLEERR